MKRIRAFGLTLICLSALAAAGFQSLTATGASAPVAASAGDASMPRIVKHGMMPSANAPAWTIAGAPDEQQDNGVLQQAKVYLPVTNNDDSATAPTATSTITPTATSTITPTTEPAPSPTAFAADFFVDDSNTTAIRDGSAQHPYPNLQAAIDTAGSDDETTIAVAAGVYTQNVRLQNKTIHLYGGFVGGTVANYAGGDGGNFTVRNPITNVSHLQGDGTDAVVSLIDAITSTLDGFRISGGIRSLEPEFGCLGGGLYVTGGSPTISHNLIENNDTRPPVPEDCELLGGGIYAGNADISILDNIIRNNTSGGGGGIAIIGGRVVISGNTVQDNTGIDDHGGGLYIASPQAEITRNLIIGNEIGRELNYGWGGGIIIFSEGTYALLSFNRVTGNYAPSVGGGVFVDEGARATLDHELIYNNDCPDGGTTGGVGIYVDGNVDLQIGSHVTVNHTTVAGHDCITQGGNGLYVEVYSGVTITNSIFWGNRGDDFIVDGTSQITATYTTAQEVITGTGNLFSDPLFADPAQHDYHLQSTVGRWDLDAGGGSGGWVVDANHSPAIDAGDPASAFAGEPSPNGSRANMGVYGNTAEASKSTP